MLTAAHAMPRTQRLGVILPTYSKTRLVLVSRLRHLTLFTVNLFRPVHRSLVEVSAPRMSPLCFEC